MITVIGYDGSALPPAARDRLDEADLVVGGARHLAAVELAAEVEMVVMGDVDAALEAIGKADHDDRDVVVLASGDPGFFGIARRLRLAGLEIELLPAVSSVAVAFARAGLTWTEAEVVSTHGRDPRRALNVVRRAESVAVLTSPAVGPREVAQVLADREDRVLFVAEQLGEADERTGWFSPQEALACTDWLQPNVVLVVATDAQEDELAGPVPWRLGPDDEPYGWALPDDAFVHRDSMITKPEVRALALARLGPRPGELVWDIGAGSGAVGVECARFGAAVILVEQDPEQAERAEVNADWHGRCQVVVGSAPEALADLPDPDAVFIGGGGLDVVEAVVARRPDRIVVTLATVERVGPLLSALKGYATEAVLLQAQRLQSLGDGHRLVPANPVFVVSGVLS